MVGTVGAVTALMQLRTDEITQLLRQNPSLGLDEADRVQSTPSNCDVAFALFMEPHPHDAPARGEERYHESVQADHAA